MKGFGQQDHEIGEQVCKIFKQANAERFIRQKIWNFEWMWVGVN